MTTKHLDFLYGLQKFGIKLGLRNIRELLSALGHPERSFPVVHIAGTNGKGSTSSMIASILSAAGYRVGLYTSPHLLRFHERIRVGGREVPDEFLSECAGSLAPAIRRTRSTFFEATTAIALKYFEARSVDVAVLETGLGGRYDATNAVTPVLSVITTVSLDHTERLGTTVGKIAREKGGIIKPGVPCLTSAGDRETLSVLGAIAKEAHARLVAVGDHSEVTVKDSSLLGLVVDLRTPRRLYKGLRLPLAGEHQALNLRLAVMAAEELHAGGSFPRVSRRAISEGLLDVRNNSGLRARMEVLSGCPPVILDVAHNPGGIAALTQTLEKLLRKPAVFVFGVMKEKDISAMSAHFRDIADLVIAVSPAGERSLSSRSVLEEFQRRAIPSIDGRSVRRGVSLGLKEADSLRPLVITGSHYVVAEALRCLQGTA